MSDDSWANAPMFTVLQPPGEIAQDLRAFDACDTAPWGLFSISGAGGHDHFDRDVYEEALRRGIRTICGVTKYGDPYVPLCPMSTDTYEGPEPFQTDIQAQEAAHLAGVILVKLPYSLSGPQRGYYRWYVVQPPTHLEQLASVEETTP